MLVLIPVAFGAYLLFRTPAPKVLSISPTRVYQGHNLRVEIQGTNLRPFMRASFNRIMGKTFLIGSTKYALIDLPDLPPGTYDVVLYDYMAEVDRLPKALTVVANTTDVTVEVVGSVRALPEPFADRLKIAPKCARDKNASAEGTASAAPSQSAMPLRAL